MAAKKKTTRKPRARTEATHATAERGSAAWWREKAAQRRELGDEAGAAECLRRAKEA